MPACSILVVAIDGLRASALGAYGNTTFPTPALDELAARSFLLDFCFAPSAELTGTYRALWQSFHPLRPDGYAPQAASLPCALGELGYQSTLVTDEAEVTVLGAELGFERCVQVQGDANVRAEDASQTALARLFAEAIDVLESPPDGPRLVWAHARGMYGPWDAPADLQQTMLDKDDPPPIEMVLSPNLLVSDRDDPDTVFRYGVGYAAQVMVLDQCWAALEEAITAAEGSSEWLVVLLGVRGFPLGEHRRVGGVDSRLYAEQLHVPWLIKFSDGLGRLARSGQLVSVLDLLPTLWDWVDGDQQRGLGRYDGTSVIPLVRTAHTAWRHALVFGNQGMRERGIRTPGWSLRYETPADSAARAGGGELFVRPDDRWEANDVAALCPDVVDGLIAASEEVAVRLAAGDAMPDIELPDEL